MSQFTHKTINSFAFRYAIRLSVVLTIGAALATTLGCNSQVQKRPFKSANAPIVSFSPSATISAALVQNSVLSSCMSCHSGLKAPNLSNLLGIRSSINGILTTTNSNSMPPSSSGLSPLGSCSKSILARWLALGMPDTSTEPVTSLPECAQKDSSEPVPGGDTTESIKLAPVTYQTFLTRILQPKCVVCHNPDPDADMPDMVFHPYSEFLKQAHRFKAPGAASEIVHSVTRKGSRRMPPPPPESNVPALTEDEVDFIVRWIDIGLPEN